MYVFYVFPIYKYIYSHIFLYLFENPYVFISNKRQTKAQPIGFICKSNERKLSIGACEIVTVNKKKRKTAQICHKMFYILCDHNFF